MYDMYTNHSTFPIKLIYKIQGLNIISVIHILTWQVWYQRGNSNSVSNLGTIRCLINPQVTTYPLRVNQQKLILGHKLPKTNNMYVSGISILNKVIVALWICGQGIQMLTCCSLFVWYTCVLHQNGSGHKSHVWSTHS